jgi:transposase
MATDPRELRGLEIAAKARIERNGDRWFVPSQSGHVGPHGNRYVVTPDVSNPQCTCPDHETRNVKCKHIWAVEFVIQREFTFDEQTNTETVTETVTVKQTYKQEWSAYNRAQSCEKEKFVELLADLCKGVEEEPQTVGRPRVPLADVVFASAFKVYSGMSGRRFMSDLRGAQTKGYLSKAAHYNSISRYLENDMLTPVLKMLIEESSLPLQAIESEFAVDSSGFSTCRFYKWVDAKYSDPKIMAKRDWVKVHLMCGVKTNIVTSVEVSERYANDTKYFKPLVESTGRRFVIQEVSADKAYSSMANLKTVIDHKAMPYIPFKSNTNPNIKAGLGPNRTTNARRNEKNVLWRRAYHYYEFNREFFLQRYHKRSNVETTFHMIKSKFGDGLRSKTQTAQVNEALCKVLCHNICCLIQSIFELGIDPTFWAQEY